MTGRIELRPLTLDDYEALVAVQVRCFPKMLPWGEEQLASQLSVWPESQLGVFIDGVLAASAAQLIVDESEYESWSDWKELSDAGMIRNHDPEGDTLYGIEMQVAPEFRGMRLARRLYEARKEICRDRNLARMVIGGRIPGYAAHKERMSAPDYVREVIQKRLFDPVLTAQLSNGFQLRELVPDYLPHDEDSAGFATSLEWPNLDHIPPRSHRKRRAMQPVRVAAVQYQMRRVESFEEFERQVTFFVDTAGDYRADFVVFPELFTTQLLSLLAPSRPGSAARSLAAFTPRFEELMAGLALQFNVNIVGGSQFVLDGTDLFNEAMLFHRDGRIDRQRKIHVTPSEARWWGVRGGDSVRAFDSDRGRVGMAICYDIEFPELARKLAADGAQLVFVPYNTNDRAGHLRVRRCAAARCVENHQYLVTAGCIGNLPDVENADVHYAQSAVLTPCDTEFAREGIAAEADANVETVLAQDLDLELLRRHKRAGTVRNWQDRRLDLYGVRWGDRSV